MAIFRLVTGYITEQYYLAKLINYQDLERHSLRAISPELCMCVENTAIPNDEEWILNI